MCDDYDAAGPTGKDLVILIKMFGTENDHLRSENDPDYRGAWERFLDEHSHQMTTFPTPMVGLALYVLINYWDLGSLLYESLPTLEKMMIRDTLLDMSETIKARSVDVVPVE